MGQKKRRTDLRIAPELLARVDALKLGIPTALCEREDPKLADALRLVIERGTAWVEEHGPMAMVPRTKVAS